MKVIVIFGTFVLLLASCTSKAPESPISVVKWEKNAYAEHFVIGKSTNEIVVRILNPDTGKEEKRLHIPRTERNLNCAVFSAPAIGMLRELKVLNAIRAVGDVRFIANETLQKKVKNGLVVSIPAMEQMNPERLVEKEVSLVWYDAFGQGFAQEKRLEQLGIQVLPSYDWKEKHPLGRLEWIKVMGVLFGKEREATAYFDKIKKNYLKTQKNTSIQPPITVLSGSMIGDTWYLPAKGSYFYMLIQDAGGSLLEVEEQRSGSEAHSFEYILNNYKTAEVWLHCGHPSKELLLASFPKYRYLDIWNKGKVYCYTWDSNRFWEEGILRPDLLLADLKRIFAEKSPSNLTYYKSL